MQSVSTLLEKHASLSSSKEKYKILFKATDLFLKSFPNGDLGDENQKIGHELCRKLHNTRFIATLPEFEHDYELQEEITFRIIKVFKTLIPNESKELKGLTELIAGMNENELDGYTFD